MVDVVVAQPTSTRTGTGYVEWSAVFAGAVAAAALSFVLLTAGAAIGLSLVSPYPSHSYGKVAASLAAFWTLFVPILSFLVGGYIAGRMRTAWDAADVDEIEFRDGVHGLLVWALGIVIGGLMAFMTAAAAGQIGASAGAAVANSNAVVAPAVDTLLRPATATSDAVTGPGAPATEPAAAPAPANQPPARITLAERGEITRVVTGALADGRLSAADKSYLASVVAQRTGISQADAAKRVDQAYADAVRAVDRARKATALAGLATVTALLIGLAAAWYAAQRGGRHRDQNIPAKFSLSRPLAPRRPAAS